MKEKLTKIAKFYLTVHPNMFLEIFDYTQVCVKSFPRSFKDLENI